MHSDGETTSYIVQLEDALNEFDAALLAASLFQGSVTKLYAELRDKRAVALSRAIEAAVPRRKAEIG